MGNITTIGSVSIGSGQPLALVAGPCAVENRAQCIDIATRISRLTDGLEVPYVFKASYKKANRSKLHSFQGVGLEEGLRALEEVESLGIPTLTDVHETCEISAVAEVVSCLQVPALLCRQTDLLVMAGMSGVPVNIKKGPFVAPENVGSILEKLGHHDAMVTERGTYFGYRELVVDFRGIVSMRKLEIPLIFDASHSIKGEAARGFDEKTKLETIMALSMAAVSVGYSGLYLEVHPTPEDALSDGEISLSFEQLEFLLPKISRLGRFLRV